MPFKITCGKCQKEFEVPDSAEGKKVKCPCGERFVAMKAKVAVEPPPLPPQVAEPPIQATIVDPVEANTPFANQPVKVNIDHGHSAKKGFFGAGFKTAMGCFAAIAVVAVGGCFVVSAIFVGGAAVTVNAIDEVADDFTKRNQEYNKKVAEYKKQIQEVASKLVAASTYIQPLEDSFRSDNEIGFDVTNNSDKAIESIGYEVTVAIPGRQVPFAVDSYFSDFDNGLEPGETKEVVLYPYDGKLQYDTAPEDAEVTINITSANWPGMPETPSRF